MEDEGRGGGRRVGRKERGKRKKKEGEKEKGRDRKRENGRQRERERGAGRRERNKSRETIRRGALCALVRERSMRTLGGGGRGGTGSRSRTRTAGGWVRSRRAREEPPIEKERKRPWDRRKRKEGAHHGRVSLARA